MNISILLLLLACFSAGICHSKGTGRPKPIFEDFFCSVDQDGDGEIERHEATKFLSQLDAVVGELPSEFSYGGKTICAEEMRDHLQTMLTPDRVVNWIIHGLQLPQYAEAFQKNAINGLDFLWLIENESWALSKELGVTSPLHRSKLTNAIVRQIFGFGSPPGAPSSVQCQASTWSGIQLSWEPPSSLGYPPLHKYLLSRWSKAESMWVLLADTKETSFLDISSLYLGKAYAYRVQAWGGHGPSEWVTVSNCSASRVQPLAKLAAGKHQGELKKVESQGINSSSSSSAPWGWIFSVNGCLFLLGILSRQNFFFRVTLASCVVCKRFFKRLWMRIYRAQASEKLWKRTLAQSFMSLYALYLRVQCKVFLLSKQAFSKEACNPEKKFLSHSDSFRDAIGYSTAECTLEDMLAAVRKVKLMGAKIEYSQGAKEMKVARSLVEQRSRVQKRTYVAPAAVYHDPVADASLSSFPSTANAMELSQSSSAGTLSRDVEVVPQRRRTRHRCNFDGCRSRFDRWYNPTDWRMRLSKHYCRECQRVFCVKHTRISPHGPSGRCGLDSTCVCLICFGHLPPEVREKLERMNKLRVGPPVHGSNGDPFPPDFRNLSGNSLSSLSGRSSSSSSLEDCVAKEDLAR